LVRYLAIDAHVTVYTLSCVFEGAYAGVIDITARTERASRKAFENIEKTVREMGLRVSEGKPKYVEVTRRPTGQKIF
jgi:hypothetical protein